MWVIQTTSDIYYAIQHCIDKQYYYLHTTCILHTYTSPCLYTLRFCAASAPPTMAREESRTGGDMRDGMLPIKATVVERCV